MIIFDMPQLLQCIEQLPEIKEPSENQVKLERYIYLLELLADDYISPEHLMVPEEDWDELAEFIIKLNQSNTSELNPYAHQVRQKLKNIVYTQKLKQELIQTKTVPSVSDDFI